MTDFLGFLLLLVSVFMTQDAILGAASIAYNYFIFIATRSSLPLHLWHRIIGWVWKKPATNSLASGIVGDLPKSKCELVLENALLRQQLIVLRRQVNRPQLTPKDRTLLVLLASRLRTWKNALLIVQPDTLLRWHKQGFRLFWRIRSRGSFRTHKPKLPAETIELIKQMAQANRLWGAERIRGELLKIDIRVCKRTIQKYMWQARQPQDSGRKKSQNWSTFLHNHASQVWACDFLTVCDLFFRPLFIFFIVELGSRRVVHLGVTSHPTDEWTAQQLREATPFGKTPRFLIRDNDRKFGTNFAHVAESSGIEVLRTPYKTPRANAVCERLLGSVRQECLNHILVLGEKHLHRVVKEFVQYYNSARPHQGIGQAIPKAAGSPVQEAPLRADGANGTDRTDGKVISYPVLGGLHHDYRRAA